MSSQYKVYFGNVPNDITEETLVDFFQRFEGIKLDKVIKRNNKCFGFLLCTTLSQLVQVIETTNNTELSGRKLIVRAADEALQAAITTPPNREKHGTESATSKEMFASSRQNASSRHRMQSQDGLAPEIEDFNANRRRYLATLTPEAAEFSRNMSARNHGKRDTLQDHSYGESSKNEKHSFEQSSDALFNRDKNVLRKDDKKAPPNLESKAHSYVGKDAFYKRGSTNRQQYDNSRTSGIPSADQGHNRRFQNVDQEVASTSITSNNSMRSSSFDNRKVINTPNTDVCKYPSNKHTECSEDMNNHPDQFASPSQNTKKSLCDREEFNGFKSYSHSSNKPCHSPTVGSKNDSLFYVSIVNFPLYTPWYELKELLSDFNPLYVFIVCDEPRLDRKPTEAVIAFMTENDATDAIMNFDNTVYKGRVILVRDAENDSFNF